MENNFTVYQDIMASDEDADNNGQLTYRIVSGHMFDNDTHFEIETLENGYGRLKPKRDLNRESMELVFNWFFNTWIFMIHHFSYMLYIYFRVKAYGELNLCIAFFE